MLLPTSTLRSQRTGVKTLRFPSVPSSLRHPKQHGLGYRLFQVQIRRQPASPKLLRDEQSINLSASGSSRSSAAAIEGTPNSAPDNSPPVIFSKNQPAGLSERLSKLTKWTVTKSKMGINRAFVFRSFPDAMKFMSRVADQAEMKNHHPTWENKYCLVNVTWTTHKPRGLSVKDVEMAEICDQVAAEIGIKDTPSQKR